MLKKFSPCTPSASTTSASLSVIFSLFINATTPGLVAGVVNSGLTLGSGNNGGSGGGGVGGAGLDVGVGGGVGVGVGVDGPSLGVGTPPSFLIFCAILLALAVLPLANCALCALV